MEAYVNTHTVNGLTTIEFYHPAQNSMPGQQLARLGKPFWKREK